MNQVAKKLKFLGAKSYDYLLTSPRQWMSAFSDSFLFVTVSKFPMKFTNASTFKLCYCYRL